MHTHYVCIYIATDQFNLFDSLYLKHFGFFEVGFSFYFNSCFKVMILNYDLMVLLGFVCGYWLGFLLRNCDGFGTFGFDVHHRYSEPVKGVLELDGLPEKGSLDYYSDMVYRDRSIHDRRRLAGNPTLDSSLIFIDGNDTVRANRFGYLHYARVSVGTPSVSFLVALDTGSDTFWLPCNCVSCVKGYTNKAGQRVNFNIYSPETSSTSSRVPCNSTLCQQNSQCSTKPDTCPYQVAYVSANTSSSGFLVEDVLHLTTENSQSKKVDANIKFGCGVVQTGGFLTSAAPNGLFGLGMEKISVPSMLASDGLVANSFSMCFGPDGIGRINFGDKGPSDQQETPFNLDSTHPTYNISITKVSVGDSVSNIDFTAIFDSGTSFTYLNDPLYSLIGNNFDAQAKETRHQNDSSLPFKYCYDLSPTQDSFEWAQISLTLRGGSEFVVTDPVIVFSVDGGGLAYCLGLIKSEDINLIGQNFMTGYRVVFDREKNVLGWKASDCYDSAASNTLPVNRTNSDSPPTRSLKPEASPGNGNGFPPGSAKPLRPAGSHSSHLKIFLYTHFILLFSIFLTVFPSFLPVEGF